ncbi:lipopolysaccharide heptosyltransferase I [Ramlibacter sp. XY19]|uniref:lipopolysaccharide heptosyltransferase I n=1 Tax=Ramlibacter paludis TaxID=2908000 RepID=UPI0023DB8430|nr:lipopolysaccharide heptosyltransferase I [Ramlibacter paludis]MCG2594198.1 lipopolysaccharide heptosyltransferase I [Ramlibacter paludis]
MNILIVKLSSLGDVVHSMPAVQDMLAAVPGARVDWVVERGFAPLVQRCAGVRRVIPCELRKWRKSPFAHETRAAWRAFRADLKQEAYDAVIDLQGLTKSALVAHMARLAPGGKRYAMANRTEGSSYEAPTRWVADVAVPVQPQSHAVRRSRDLCAAALGYAVPAGTNYGLVTSAAPTNCIALIHGTSRDDKLWPEASWIQLGKRLLSHGYSLAFPHGNDEERERSERLAGALGPRAQAWPRLALDALTERLGGCAGAIGVDSGLSHIAVALDLPHVQIYNFDTAWRTGPPADAGRQRSVYAEPAPSVEAVWAAWKAVAGKA